MNRQFEVSVVMSTYNRRQALPDALESLMSQKTGGVSYEVIVVDNNSTDRTREVVESFVAGGGPPLRYVFEPRQGVSFGRNSGVTAARARIIAFTDDDMRMAPDWVANARLAFDLYPEADYFGGKSLPRWETLPPPWLTRRHWSPLALLDYGEEPLPVDANHRQALITANFAIRRAAFERAGGFSPLAQRVANNVGSAEDRELLLRLWRTGARGMYLPDLIGWAEVPPGRMTKSYHRRWHRGHGCSLAMMRDEYLEPSKRGRLFDVPAHLYRQAAEDAAQFFVAQIQGDEENALWRETQLCFFAGYFRQRYRDYRDADGRNGK